MATIRISASGQYLVLVDDHDLIAVEPNLENAMLKAKGYSVSFGWFYLN